MERTTNSKIAAYTRMAGSLLFLAGVIIFMGIITGEVFYVGVYSTSSNTISDLGVAMPSASIFNATMISAGTMVLVGAYLVQRVIRKSWFTVLLGLAGLGMLGVGIFPENHETIHQVFSLLTFISGAFTAPLSARVVSGPFRYISITLGSIAIAAMCAVNILTPLLGLGGTERWVAYPSILWVCGFGAYLLGAGHMPELTYSMTSSELKKATTEVQRLTGKADEGEKE
jgi:hypothetical membrane protein